MKKSSKIENLGFRRQINEMWSSIQDHIRKEFGLVHLTGFGTGYSDPDGYFIFYQIRQIIPRAIPGTGCFVHFPGGIGPFNPVIYKKDIHLMSFGVGDLTELKASGCAIHLILA